MPTTTLRLAGELDAPVGTGTDAIERDIAAWTADLSRKKRSKDYLQRGPSLIRSLARRFGWQSSLDATTDQLATWLAGAAGTGHSQNNRISMLREFFRHCELVRKTIRENPARDLDRAHDGTGEGVREFAGAEMSAIYGAAEGHWKTATGVFATTALRRGAVFRGIRVGWFDAKRSAVVIPAGFLKNRKPQTIPLNTDGVEVFTAATVGRQPEEFIVPIHFDQGTWLSLLKRAGVARRDERGRPAGTHSFRKGVITLLADAGVHPKVAQQLAGHGDIRQTMRIYTQLGDAQQTAAMKKLPSLNPNGNGTCGTPMGKNGESSSLPLVNGWARTDTHSADREESLMQAHTHQPGQNSRPRRDSLDGQQSVSASASRGRLFHSGSHGGALAPAGNDPTGIWLPLGAHENHSQTNPTGTPTHESCTSHRAGLPMLSQDVLGSEAQRSEGQGLRVLTDLCRCDQTHAQAHPEGQPDQDGTHPGERPAELLASPGPHCACAGVRAVREGLQDGRAPSGLQQAAGGGVAVPLVPPAPRGSGAETETDARTAAIGRLLEAQARIIEAHGEAIARFAKLLGLIVVIACAVLALLFWGEAGASTIAQPPVRRFP